MTFKNGILHAALVAFAALIMTAGSVQAGSIDETINTMVGAGYQQAHEDGWA